MSGRGSNMPVETVPLTKRSRLRKLLLLLALTPVVLVLAWFVYSLTPHGRERLRQGIAGRTQAEIQALAIATQLFHEGLDRYPTNLTELQTNRSSGILFQGRLTDLWGRPYIYTPPTSNTPGKLQTFGADGNPGGNEFDGDAVIEIQSAPTNSNSVP